LNNSGNDPSGVGNASKLATPPAPGTNTSGTAQSSGSRGGGVNSQPGMTTGAAASSAAGSTVAGPQTETDKNTDAAIAEENKNMDRKVKSICRGC
jgi:hypothetical protein